MEWKWIAKRDDLEESTSDVFARKLIILLNLVYRDWCVLILVSRAPYYPLARETSECSRTLGLTLMTLLAGWVSSLDYSPHSLPTPSLASLHSLAVVASEPHPIH